MHDRLGIHYINTGDWVESCTAICETHEGQFELIRWVAQTQPVTKPPKAPRSLRIGRRKVAPDLDASAP
jgi:hypothetical protein